jgi:DNA modification methylase
MAPEIALQKIELLTGEGDVVLDPMCGSGTVLRVAAEQGRAAIGSDVDPLAVVITRTTCHTNWSTNLRARAEDVVRQAKRLNDGLPPWIAHDPETYDFIEYWFARAQRHDLARLARVLATRPRTDDPLRVALSRIIVTKDVQASLARDTSHSRPHRVQLDNTFDVFAGFVTAAQRLANSQADRQPGDIRPKIRHADGRNLSFLRPGSVDLAVTSPPYLNAIDYLRGHRMSLVWLGWTMSEIREIRSGSVGAERGIQIVDHSPAHRMATDAVPEMSKMPVAQQRMIHRFTNDIIRLTRSMGRVVRPGGHLVMIVADSQLRGIPVANSKICESAAQRSGFELKEQALRPLPAQHRYLPPPHSDTGTLAKRMKEEVILTFQRSATAP